MPVYTYRREDGTTFDIRQSFADAALTVDPESGQRVVRVMQPAGIIFKGSGFYVNDSKGSKKNLSSPANGSTTESSKESTPKTETPVPAAEKPAPKVAEPAAD